MQKWYYRSLSNLDQNVCSLFQQAQRRLSSRGKIVFPSMRAASRPYHPRPEERITSVVVAHWHLARHNENGRADAPEGFTKFIQERQTHYATILKSKPEVWKMQDVVAHAFTACQRPTADCHTCTVPCRAPHLQGRARLPDSSVRCPRLTPWKAVNWTRPSQIWAVGIMHRRVSGLSKYEDNTYTAIYTWTGLWQWKVW